MAGVAANGIATGQASITTLAVLVPARGDRKRVTIINGAVIAAIGGPAVAAGTGLLLAIGGQVTLETTAAISAISTGAATTMSYIEEFA